MKISFPKWTALVGAFVFILTGQAQSQIEKYVQEGIQHHDNKAYDQAISSYKKALKLDPSSSLVNYELALSYLHKGDFDSAIAFSDVVIKQKGSLAVMGYLTKASALDQQGNTKTSTKVLKKAIKKSSPNHLLHYNLALNYVKTNDMESAEKQLVDAIYINPQHSSSHLVLANIKMQQQQRIPALLAAYYFMYLEPNSGRSQGAWKLLQEALGGNVKRGADQPYTINISLPSDNDSNPFKSVEMLLSISIAANNFKENEGKSDEQLFVENTNSLFSILNTVASNLDKSIWRDFYLTFYQDLEKSEHLESFCMYSMHGVSDTAADWVKYNMDALQAFEMWLKTLE